MGQQQLLLVILVTIIVGIATVVAINIFGSAADQANQDAVRQDLLAASVQAQAIYARPTLMNGANRDFTNLTAAQILPRLNIPGTLDDPDNPTAVNNENGDYSVTRSANELVVTGAPTSGGDPLVATVTFDPTLGEWSVTIADGTTTVTSDDGDGG